MHAVHTVLIFIKPIFSFVVSGQQWVNLRSGLKGGAAFLLLMFLFFGTGHAASDGVFRINYGVIFNRIGSFHTVYDHWMHTFHINLPKEMPLPPHRQFCALDQARSDPQVATSLDNVCVQFKTAAATLFHIREQAIGNLNKLRLAYCQLLSSSLFSGVITLDL